MDNITLAIRKMSHGLERTVIDVCGRTVTVSTIWLPSPWCTHETIVMWDEEFHVVSVNAGTVDALQAHLHWTCFPHLATFVLNMDVSS